MAPRQLKYMLFTNNFFLYQSPDARHSGQICCVKCILPNYQERAWGNLKMTWVSHPQHHHNNVFSKWGAFPNYISVACSCKFGLKSVQSTSPASPPIIPMTTLLFLIYYNPVWFIWLENWLSTFRVMKIRANHGPIKAAAALEALDGLSPHLPPENLETGDTLGIERGPFCLHSVTDLQSLSTVATPGLGSSVPRRNGS